MRRGCFNALLVCALIIGGAQAADAGAAPELPAPALPLAAPRTTAAVQAPVPAAPQEAGSQATATMPAMLQPTAIDACISRLDPQLDIGYDRIAARCPDLVRQLDSGAWAPWLPRGWKEPGNDLSAGGLREFRELVTREAASAASARAPDVRRLQSVLVELGSTSSETGWSRFKSWLRSMLERRDQSTDEGWFTRMVSHVGVSQSLIRIVIYGALAGVVLLAGVIIANEARAAGLLSRRDTARRSSGDATADGGSSATWGDVEQAPTEDKPRLLLELIVRRLSDGGLLPPAGALTVRELTRAARLPDAGDRSRLRAVALAAERVRYSVRDRRFADLDESIASGRQLLERLNASAPG
jgi:hypothetical protein